MNRNEKILVFLLRLCGGLTVTAFATALLPAEWMAATHRWLGLGEFPASPLVDYLTRSTSLLYGFHGVLLLVIASDPRRYRRVIAFVATMDILFGAAMIAVDLHAGMPVFWIVAEGPPVIALGIVLHLLLRGVPDPERG